ncbi:MAG: ABC transporter permease [Chthoniobacteraceae bacterium]
MNFWNSLAVGIREIWSHKFRSFLTMLGVILGVASLLSTFALTDGMAKASREYMTQMGGVERINVIAQDVPQEQLLLTDTSPGRTVDDAELIAAAAKHVSRVTPWYTQYVPLLRGSEKFRAYIYGVWPDYIPINRHVVEYGRSISQLDLDEGRAVCVIGTRIVEQLWPEKPQSKPVGETILIGGKPYKIIGIFQYYENADNRAARLKGKKPVLLTKSGKSYNPYTVKNTTVIIPFNTFYYEYRAANVVGTEDQGPIRKIDGLTIQASDPEHVQDAIDEASSILMQTHRGVEDFTFDTRQELAESIEKTARNTRLTGGLIAGISLIVGGIGITNIMLASITERIREIGVRRAIGAKSGHIFTQILVESTVIGIIGGFLGLVAALGMTHLIKFTTDGASLPVIQTASVLMSFAFAVLIGVFSGIYPAWTASRIAPIEALRYG